MARGPCWGNRSCPGFYFASQVLQDGRFWLAGGEYTGPGLLANWGNSAEIYDPVANTWTAVAPFPAQAGCPSIKYVSGNVTNGSPAITNVYPYTTGITVGEGVSGTGIPAGSTVVSVDSPSQITISANATSTGNARQVNLANSYTLTACLGDEPSILLPGGIVLVGDLVNRNAWLYNVGTNSWSMTGAKVYNDQSDEEVLGKTTKRHNSQLRPFPEQSDGRRLRRNLRPGGGYLVRHQPLRRHRQRNDSAAEQQPPGI